MCCLHNASVDDSLSGWCKGAPERLAAARRCVAMIEGARAVSDIGERVWRRAYNQSIAGTPCMAYSVKPGRPVNVSLLFGL